MLKIVVVLASNTQYR